MDIGYAHPR